MLFLSIQECKNDRRKRCGCKSYGNPVMPGHGQITGARETRQRDGECKPLSCPTLKDAGAQRCALSHPQMFTLLFCHPKYTFGGARDDLIKAIQLLGRGQWPGPCLSLNLNLCVIRHSDR